MKNIKKHTVVLPAIPKSSKGKGFYKVVCEIDTSKNNGWAFIGPLLWAGKKYDFPEGVLIIKKSPAKECSGKQFIPGSWRMGYTKKGEEGGVKWDSTEYQGNKDQTKIFVEQAIKASKSFKYCGPEMNDVHPIEIVNKEKDPAQEIKEPGNFETHTPEPAPAPIKIMTNCPPEQLPPPEPAPAKNSDAHLKLAMAELSKAIAIAQKHMDYLASLEDSNNETTNPEPDSDELFGFVA